MNLKDYKKMRDKQRKESAKRAIKSDKELLAVSGPEFIQNLYSIAKKMKEVKKNGSTKG